MNELPIPGSIEAVARLYKAGHRLAIATNQSGIARGFYGTDVLDSMHQKMAQLVEAQGGHIDFIAYCPHHPDEHCRWQPLTGLLDQIVPLTAEQLEVPQWRIPART